MSALLAVQMSFAVVSFAVTIIGYVRNDRLLKDATLVFVRFLHTPHCQRGWRRQRTSTSNIFLISKKVSLHISVDVVTNVLVRLSTFLA